ncbi:MAG: hypothetical protein AAFR22_17780, partial [Chloroflexota bacterium]
KRQPEVIPWIASTQIAHPFSYKGLRPTACVYPGFVLVYIRSGKVGDPHFLFYRWQFTPAQVAIPSTSTIKRLMVRSALYCAAHIVGRVSHQ